MSQSLDSACHVVDKQLQNFSSRHSEHEHNDHTRRRRKSQCTPSDRQDFSPAPLDTADILSGSFDDSLFAIGEWWLLFLPMAILLGIVDVRP